MLEACLRLFKTMPESQTDQEKVKFDSDRGLVYFAPVSEKLEEELYHAIKAVFPDYSGFKATFYNSWKDLTSRNGTQVLIDQVLHYFSTYGVESLLGESSRVALPNYAIRNENTSLEVFTIGITPDWELEEKLTKMFYSNVALSYQDIQDMFDVAGGLEGFDVREINPDRIQNRELKTYYYTKTNTVPKDPTEIMRLLMFKVNGKTLLINKPAAGYFSKSELNEIDNILVSRTTEVASVFYRYKKFLVSLKHLGSEEIRKHINAIRKIADFYWIPRSEENRPDYVTTQLLQGRFPTTELEKLTLVQLIKVHNRIASYAYQIMVFGKAYNLYTIRNMKVYVDTQPKYDVDEHIYGYTERLKEMICRRIQDKKDFLIPYIAKPELDYALPTTTKSFLGDIPLWTSKNIGNAKTVGIHWNKDDIDLSMILKDHKIGWNGSWNLEPQGTRKCLYSGDMTRGVCTNPNCENYQHSNGQEKGICPRCGKALHASEAIYFGEERGLVDVSLYNTQQNTYDICFSEDDVERGKVLDRPQNAVRVNQDFGTAIIGMTYKTPTGEGKFVFSNFNGSQGNVAYCSETTEPLMQVLQSYGESSFKLSDLYKYTELKLDDEGETWRMVERFTKADFIELASE